MDRHLAALLRDEHGATAVEYAIMASMIAVAIAATVGLLGQQVATFFSDFTAAVPW